MTGNSATVRRCIRILTILVMVCGLGVMAGCTPQGVAVGDMREGTPVVDHDSVDEPDVLIGVVGSQDVPHDREVLESIADAGLHAVYAPAPDGDGVDAAAQSGVRDFVNRGVNVVVVIEMDAADDTGGDTATSWDDALDSARTAGIPVILLDPRQPVDDPTLYAAKLVSVLSAASDEAVPFNEAVLSIVNARAHGSTMRVSLTQSSAQSSQAVRP